MTKLENTADVELVKNCWLKIKSAKGSDYFVDNFYQSMFEQHPEVHAFFPEDLGTQKTKLLNTLNNIINGLEYIHELKGELAKLGKQHRDLGIKPDMFDDFITTVVAAANSSSDFTLTNKELTAWENAFRKVSNIMLEAY